MVSDVGSDAGHSDSFQRLAAILPHLFSFTSTNLYGVLECVGYNVQFWKRDSK